MSSLPRSYRLVERGQQLERTRERILTAARAAFVAGPYEGVTLARVASDAGVTSQTVLNHFQSKRGLLVAVVDALGAQVNELRGSPPVGDVGAVVDSLMRQYEELGDMNVSYVAAAAGNEELTSQVQRARESHQAWLEEMFADQLSASPDRSRAVAALYAATDVGTWKLLRRDLGHSMAETAAALEVLVRGALASDGER